MFTITTFELKLLQKVMTDKKFDAKFFIVNDQISQTIFLMESKGDENDK